MLKILCAGCLGLSPAIWAQFTLEMCITVGNRKKIPKTFYFGVQGHSRSSMLTFLGGSLPKLVMISSMSLPICNHFYAKRASSGKMASF